MSIVCEASQDPGLVSSLTPPLVTLGEDHISGPLRHGSRGLEISPKGQWTSMAAQRVPETPQEINEWLKGTISHPELLMMSFQENSEENLIGGYSPEMSESENWTDFANLRPVTIEGSHQLLLGHSDTTMEVDFEGLCCVKRQKNLLCRLWLTPRWLLYSHTKRRHLRRHLLLLQIFVLNTLTA